MFKLSQNSINNMKGIDPRLIEIANLAIAISYIDFGIPKDGGLRSTQDQRRLFEKGVSKCDGEKYISEHQTGNALDFYAYVDGSASWDLHHLTIVVAAFMEAARRLKYKIEWGGHWKNFRDLPHIQLVG